MVILKDLLIIVKHPNAFEKSWFNNTILALKNNYAIDVLSLTKIENEKSTENYINEFHNNTLLKAIRKRKKYNLIIAFEAYSLMIANFLSIINKERIKIVYYSLELNIFLESGLIKKK